MHASSDGSSSEEGLHSDERGDIDYRLPQFVSFPPDLKGRDTQNLDPLGRTSRVISHIGMASVEIMS